MIYSDFKGDRLSMLGFGCMRFPLLSDGSIDQEQVNEMVKMARANGLNYFDTAYPYHGGRSELALAEALKDVPRAEYFLADKFPGHQTASTYNPAEVFEHQLRKLRTGYFDYYLLHNVYERSIDVYKDPQWDIIPYFVEQKKLGRIRHLGFSSHGRVETMKAFLDYCKENGYEMEFCQIQLNYVDWTLQDAKAKVDLLNEYGIGIWVMEPIKGGSLKDNVPKAFRFVEGVPGVKMILSGMSALSQMEENLATFENPNPLSEEEMEELMQDAEARKAAIPCTGCRYCCDECPMGLNIPMLIANYNDAKFGNSSTPYQWLDSLPEEQRPDACIGCGACMQMCPQNIEIPDVLAHFAELYEKSVKWDDICRERELTAKRMREEEKDGNLA